MPIPSAVSRALIRRRLGWWLCVCIAGLLASSTAHALDEVILTNGRRYLGTITQSTPESIVLRIDGGAVEFPRSAVKSPPYFGSDDNAAARVETQQPAQETIAPHALPNVAQALRHLQTFAWAGKPRQVPVLVVDHGRWQMLPGVSFWVGGFCQLSFYGDPARPAAIEISLHHPPAESWEEKRRLLEFMMGVVPGLAADQRFDQLKLTGDSFAVRDLWFVVTGPESRESPGRWSVRLVHEQTVAAARATTAEVLALSETVTSTVLDPTQPRSWQRGSWTHDDLAWLRESPVASPASDDTRRDTVERQPWNSVGGERVYVRAYVRERGKYARANTDWLRDLAAAQ